MCASGAESIRPFSLHPQKQRINGKGLKFKHEERVALSLLLRYMETAERRRDCMCFVFRKGKLSIKCKSTQEKREAQARKGGSMVEERDGEERKR